MNDKCAAGTGRFLGAAAAALDLGLDDLGPTALKSEKPVRISTTCTVFAESEVLAWLGKGKKVEDILWGVHQSIASRSAALMRRVGIEDEITFTGGVTRNVAMIKALEEAVGQEAERQRGVALHGRDGRGPVRARSHSRQPVPGEGDGDGTMSITAGIDVGSTYTKAVILEGDAVIGRAMSATGFKLTEVSETLFDAAIADAGISRDDVAYTIATGYGRHQCRFKDLAVTDLTAAARGANFFFPGTRTVLDIGGQTMKATRIDEAARVKSFRLNDKCAAGTGAFLEKTARYMGYSTEEIGGLMDTSKEHVTDLRRLRGLCRVGGDQPPLPGDLSRRHHAGQRRFALGTLGPAAQAGEGRAGAPGVPRPRRAGRRGVGPPLSGGT